MNPTPPALAAMAPGNLARLHELVDEFNDLAERKTASLRQDPADIETYDNLERAQVVVAYQLVGLMQGMGAGGK